MSFVDNLSTVENKEARLKMLIEPKFRREWIKERQKEAGNPIGLLLKNRSLERKREERYLRLWHNVALVCYFQHSGLAICDKYILCAFRLDAFKITAFCEVNKKASFDCLFGVHARGSSGCFLSLK
ncbi:hypothetical protein HQ45_04445 [Porphyromonas crevioricanis]|uniref:Uncharacterized protein n=1 Tax=Porphyromonas crevioricanis JCM 15906 TaxID=1305617 RepID=T1DR64_9PORP|nr:hypothetical protein HQ45_04445 [Porphyromonas crevioricanis]GAD05110.1 hypothetical protein PORCRE_808 [Porphyromonas crevioricanis JCM 15906]GAD07346.1 hypothetical protein PORCAN_966 [Porphyromonas crevioricanis JCM 13913]